MDVQRVAKGAPKRRVSSMTWPDGRKLTLSHNLDIVAMQVKALLGGDV
jgi:hypothetical protein